jgi:hypothetical protein
MAPVGLDEAKEKLENYKPQYCKGKITVYVLTPHIQAAFFRETDSPDIDIVLHFTYDGKDLTVDRVESIDKRLQKRTDIIDSWQSDVRLLDEYKRISESLGLPMTIYASAKLSENLGLRVQAPAVRGGKQVMVTTVKTTVTDQYDSRTVTRTIDGESADLQLKWLKHPDGTLEFWHIHCQSRTPPCKGKSRWSKISGLPIEKFYEVTQKAPTSWIIRCKTCGRRWSSAGETQTL